MIRREPKASASFHEESSFEYEHEVEERTGLFKVETRTQTHKHESPSQLFFDLGGKGLIRSLEGGEAEDVWRGSRREPKQIGEVKGRCWWLYKEILYSTAEDDLEPDEVQALIEEQQNKKRLKIARAKTVAAMAGNLDSKAKRQPIPQEVKVAVWQRDQGACVQCQSRENLEFDHIVPFARGGSNTERNIQLLCADCNREKGASL